MADGPVFPAFLKLEYQRDNSAKDTFLAEMASITTDAQRNFKQSFDEIGNIVKRSLSGFRSGEFRIDLDTSTLRQAANDAEFAASRLAFTRDAATRLAAATGDTSQATQTYLQALRAQTIEAERNAGAAREQVTTYSRLQAEIDRTIGKNQQLAASYRATFEEQAKATNYAHAYQQGINEAFAPGLSRPTKSASSSASVFEEQSYSSKADTRSGLDRMLAGSASLDRAAVSATTLEQVLGRVSAKGREVSASLADAAQQAARAAEEEAARVASAKAAEEAATKEAADAMRRYAAQANDLRQRLDPALAAQQRYDAELARADELLAANAISAQEYAQAQKLATAGLQDAWRGLTQAENENAAAKKRGSTETQNVINGVRAQRVAFIQLGQQMQDVVVQTQMGTSATTVFVQQVPQMAYALSGLEGNVNKTYDRIGKFATFLAGGWGAAIFAAVAVLGPLATELLGVGDAEEDAKGKAYDFSKGLNVLELSASSAANAMAQLAQEMRGAIAVQGDFLRAKADIADKSVTDLEAELKSSHDQLAAAKKRLSEGGIAYSLSGEGLNDAWRADHLPAIIADQQKALASARMAQINAQISVSQRAVIDSLDAATRATDTYNEAVGRLNDRLQKSKDDPVSAQSSGIFIDQKGYEAEFLRLTKIKNAAIKAAQDAKKSVQEYGREIDMAAAKSIAQAAGFQVNSGNRSYADQKRLYDQWVAQGKPADNPVAVPGTSAHERGNALDIQIADGVTPASIKKAYEDAGVHLTKIFKERGHFHIEWSTSGADKVQREEDQLAKFGKTAAESIARVNERFNEQPRLVDAAAQATRQLDDIIAELEKRHPPGFEKMIAQASAAKAAIDDALVRPYRELQRDSDRRIQQQQLLLQGRDAEANALQDIWRLEEKLGPLTAERRAEVLRMAQAEQKQVEALQRAQEMQQIYLDTTRSIRSTVEGILGGYGKLSDLKNIGQQLRGRVMAENLFGDVFRDMDKWVKEKTGIGSSVDLMATETERAGAAAGTFADTLIAAANKIAQGGSVGTGAGSAGSSWALGNMSIPSMLAAPKSTPAAANENPQIVVTANLPPKVGKTVNDLTPDRYFEEQKNKMRDALTSALEKSGLGPGLSKTLAGPLAGAFEGYISTGTTFGAVLGGLKDIKGLPEDLSKKLGSAFSGAKTGANIADLSNMLGIGLDKNGSVAGGAIGGVIGDLTEIPWLGAAGSVVGGILGKLFGKRPRGGGAVTQDSVTVSANDNGITGSLDSFGSTLQSSITKIADALGASVGSYDVGIGRYKEYYQVSGVGNDKALGNSYFQNRSSTALYDGTDAEAAMRAAILGAIQDGAVKGIHDGALRLLKAGKDLDTQIQKAVDFENVFKKLKSYTDPVGAALDTLDSEFTKLKATFTEAGASAEDFAALEKLYGIERTNAVKQAMDQITGSLQSLYNDLTVGNSALSLRDRKAEALATYQPLADRVKAGDTTAYDDYAAAARQLLEIEQQMSGSQSDYFALLSEVTSLTKTQLDSTKAVADASANRDSPFSTSTSTSTSVANDNSSVTNAIGSLAQTLLDGLGYKLDAVNTNLGSLIQQGINNGTITGEYAGMLKTGTW
ncbi:UNVERIFIED_ORG: hypothetical protein M2348_001332 [Sphingomonas sp. R1F5B]